MRHIFIIFYTLIVWSCGSTTTDESVIFFQKGNIQLKEKNYKEAARLFGEAIEKNAQFADAYLNRGLAYYYQNNLQKALADFEQALQIEPTYSAALFNRAQVKYDLGQKDCLSDITKVIQQVPDSAAYYVLLGNAKVLNEDLSGGMAAFSEAIRLDSKQTEAFVNRGYLYFKEGRMDMAKADFEEALSLNPKQPFALNNLSLLSAKAGRYAIALSLIDQALALAPAQEIFINNKAFYLLMSDQPDLSADLIAQSLRLNDQNPYALRNRGIYKFQAKQYDQAQKDLEQALQFDATTEYATHFLGKCYEAQGDLKRACQLWTQSSDELSQKALQINCR
jgi:tetratricopeptide (TPR) repeat protein